MIVACGEALVDLVPVVTGDQLAYIPRCGGSPYNVAIGLARLGTHVGFLGRVSTDLFGRMLRDRLITNGVDCQYLLEGDEATTIAIVDLETGREPRFAFYGDGTADRLLAESEVPPFDEDVGVLHFGSVSLVREPAASTYEALMRRERGRRLISLDPNVRPTLIDDRNGYVRRVEGWVALADLVKVSRADLAWLYPELTLENVARHWQALGPSLVVVTKGAGGATGITRAAIADDGGAVVAVADTVGAGDAFMSGLLTWLGQHARLNGMALAGITADELTACLAFANGVASRTCTRVGAEPPWREELSVPR